MGLFSPLNKTNQTRPTAQIWDKKSFFKLVNDTDDETADLTWEAFGKALADATKEWKFAASTKDINRVRQIAHKIRPSSLLLGFKEFALLNQKIEQDLTNNIAESGMDQDLSQWLSDANSVLQILNQQPKDLLG